MSGIPKSVDESKVKLLKAGALGLSNSTGSPSKVQVNYIYFLGAKS